MMSLSRLLAFVAVLLPTGAHAAERKLYVSSFDRIRVQGPFDVRIVTGPPTGGVTGDKDVIEGIEVRADGNTLVVRSAMATWQERPRARQGDPVVVTLSTPGLIGASITGAGRIAVDRMKGPRIDLSVTGAGAVSVARIDADAANATLVGDGAITVAGRAAKVRLMTNGGGSIDADALDAGDVFVRVDGLGTTRARARYTAQVSNTGLGQVGIAGNPKCQVTSSAGGPVVCGEPK